MTIRHENVFGQTLIFIRQLNIMAVVWWIYEFNAFLFTLHITVVGYQVSDIQSCYAKSNGFRSRNQQQAKLENLNKLDIKTVRQK